MTVASLANPTEPGTGVPSKREKLSQCGRKKRKGGVGGQGDPYLEGDLHFVCVAVSWLIWRNPTAKGRNCGSGQETAT
ncbi:hypothetical protein E5D57_008198 [Metarhizium anisopliae]|nr:hypothetical protein E5D57_008198 [Metarhizium anisopliae]